MGREVKRVPVDFDWPLNKVWQGFIQPDRFNGNKCSDCDGRGESIQGKHYHNLWYGYIPFDPTSTGSTPLEPDTPAVWKYAERNVTYSPTFYGPASERVIALEATRLADLWNGMWCHHLSQEDVDALVDAGRLMDFTHTWSKETGWVKIEPPVTPTAAEVNEWSIGGFGHDSLNSWVVINARCERDGVDSKCSTCDGHGSIEAYPGQRAEAEAWQREEPPTGEGWQLWETVTEGSPISPVFADKDGLIEWLTSPEYTWGTSEPMPRDQAERFVNAGWAPSFISSESIGVVPGEMAVG